MNLLRMFKTKRGTELPIMDLHGKEYMQVAHRVIWFREDRPDWSIHTSFVILTEKGAVAKAEILNEQGRVMSTSHKTESAQSFPDFAEKAETGAVGRALALCGYGTQFTSVDLDEGDRIVDSPLERRTGSLVPHKSQGAPSPSIQAPKPVSGPVIASQGQAPSGSGLTEPQLKRMYAIARANLWEREETNQFILFKYKQSNPKLLTKVQYEELCDKIMPQGQSALSEMDLARTPKVGRSKGPAPLLEPSGNPPPPMTDADVPMFDTPSFSEM